MVNIAVVIPVYNTGKYLEECLNSILTQTYKNFTAFVVNDGSTDNSADILRKFAKKDNRIIVIHKSNAGVSAARNTALIEIFRRNNFDLVCFLDSDDYVKSDFLETYVSSYAKHCSDYTVCGVNSFNKSGTLENITTQDNTEIQCTSDGAYKHFQHLYEWSVVKSNSSSYFLNNRCFATSVIKGEFFDESLKKGEDQELLIRVLRKINKGIIIDDVKYMYRIRKSSLSHNTDTASTDNDLALITRLINEQGNFSQIGKEAIYSRAFDLWWNALRTSNTSKRNTKEFYYIFNKLYRNKRYIKSNKVCGRFLVFRLGVCFMYLYFLIGSRRAINIDNPYD